MINSHNAGLFSISTTLPGITRGNHFHTRKIERFLVISGSCEIKMRKICSNHVYSFIIDKDLPAYVDIPIWYTHNLTNIGNSELITNFWINEFYDPNDSDTFFEIV